MIFSVDGAGAVISILRHGLQSLLERVRAAWKTHQSAYNSLRMRASHFMLLWKGVTRILLAENLAARTLPRNGSI